MPRRRPPAYPPRKRVARRREGARDRRTLDVLQAIAARRARVARRGATTRRPGLRRRGLARNDRVHRAQTRDGRRARRADRRFRGVHAALPRVLVGTGHPLAALDGSHHDDLRRPRRPRRLEHLVALDRRDARQAVVGGAHHRCLHGLLGLPTSRQPLAARARRRDNPAAREGGGRRRPFAPQAGTRVGPRVGGKPLGLTTATSATHACSSSTRAPRASSRTTEDR